MNDTTEGPSMPKQLGDSHSLSIPEGADVRDTYLRGPAVVPERPLPDSFTD